MRSYIVCGVVATALVLVTGCSVSAQPVGEAPAGDNRPVAAATVATEIEATTFPTPVETGPGVQAFGSVYTWQDGLSVTIGEPGGYKPSGSAAGTGEFSQFIIFDVTVVNKTGGIWDPSLFSASVQSGNQEGSRIFDSAKLPDAPRTKLLDGREATFKLAYAVADPNDLVLEVTPDWEHQSVMFQKA